MTDQIWLVRTLQAVGAGAMVVVLATCGSTVGSQQREFACEEHSFSVEVSSLKSDRQQVYAVICRVGQWLRDSPVQVLLHGGAYDHRYWDWPYRPDTYSYVRQAALAGYVTVNLDRLGYGRSSRPEGNLLDFETGAEAVRQVAQQIKGGAVGPGSRVVVLNGHSMGGLIAVRAAAHGDVSAVIVSGILPAKNRRFEGEGRPREDRISQEFHPATADPRFAEQPWSAGYVTTRPGSRTRAFHYPGTYEPAIAAVEEAIADTVSIGELRSVQTESGAEDASHTPVQVPTAYVLGHHDTIACPDGDCTTDSRADGADLIVASSGHSINASIGAQEFYLWTFAWIRGLGIG